MLRATAAATALVMLASCNGGTGSTTTVFFGSNGNGGCRTLTVRVQVGPEHVAGAPAEACMLDEALVAAGCRILAGEQDGALQVTILGCIVPEAASLFSCAFRGVDPANVQRVTSSLCGCADRCDPFPPICVALADDRSACEQCLNGVDDDGNGSVDCVDENCRHVLPCASTTTTSTSSSTLHGYTTTTSTPTTNPPSTTTTLVAGKELVVDFDIASASGLIGALQIAVDYSSAKGTFVGTAGAPQCNSHVPGSLVSFNDDDVNKTLRMGFVSLQGVQAPVRLATCRFAYGSEAPVKEDFGIVVEDAADPDFNPIQVDVEPEVEPAPPTTVVSTTTSSTSTTLAVPDSELYTIYFDLTQASAPLGALQFDVGYEGSPGEFVGSFGDVDCRSRVGNNRAYNDLESNDTLTIGFVSLEGLDAPLTLVRCRYRAPAQAPVAADFAVTIADASGTDFEPATATVTVRVSAAP
ncbi:MAG TPA: hypothetical protein VEC57_15735 [Candidatus Limnocylindrales bacterium]|nr:hypothetical protein [Candidatus Limnocylindrales bacterium]